MVPAKPPARGKSRLHEPGELDDEQRRDLAEAFALDTATACLAVTSVTAVLVVTDDAALARTASAAGCVAIPDGDAGGLNPALLQAVAEARRRWPDARPVAVLADLPALRPADLDQALGSLRAGVASYVADHTGLGTTLYTAPYDAFDPAFGPGSAAAHRAAGARPVPGALVSLRHDVDDLDDLRAAAALGLGPRTRVVAATLRVGSSPPSPDRLEPGRSSPYL